MFLLLQLNCEHRLEVEAGEFLETPKPNGLDIVSRCKLCSEYSLIVRLVE